MIFTEPKKSPLTVGTSGSTVIRTLHKERECRAPDLVAFQLEGGVLTPVYTIDRGPKGLLVFWCSRQQYTLLEQVELIPLQQSIWSTEVPTCLDQDHSTEIFQC